MATTTTLSNDIITMVSSDVVTGIFRNDEVWNLVDMQKSPGDTAYRWHVQTAGLSGTLKAEGDAFSAAASTAYSRASQGYHLHDGTIRVTDHLKAALGPRNEGSYWNSLAREVLSARAGIQDTINTRWLGSGAATDGLLLAVDSTGTYAALDHAAVTGWDSAETNVAGVLTYAALDDMRETLRDNERRSKANLILLPENQVTNYTRLSGPGNRNTLVQNTGGTDPGGPNFDIGANVDNPAFGGIQMRGLADLTDTVILFLKKEDMTIYYHERVAGDGGWGAEEVPREGHATDINFSWFGVLIYRDPFRAGKLVGVTA